METTPGKRSIGYYVNWAIYARAFEVTSLPTPLFTHLNYAFAALDPATGAVSLSDPWSDTQRPPPGTPPLPPTSLSGNLLSLLRLKHRHRTLKLLLSIGGWTTSSAFPAALATPASRATFVASALDLLSHHGFDGLDIDYEYPSTPSQSADLTTTLRLLRAALTSHATSLSLPPNTFLLSLALPASPSRLAYFDLPRLTPLLDFYNLMAYDYGSPHNAAWHPLTQTALSYLTARGVPRAAVNIGIPLYGRTISGPTGAGSWEPGIWDAKALPLPGATVHRDAASLACWSEDAATGAVVSYDDAATAAGKARAVVEGGWGGVMWWETSGDFGVGRGSLVEAAAGVLGAAGWEERRNCVEYPGSRFGNVRDGKVE